MSTFASDGRDALDERAAPAASPRDSAISVGQLALRACARPRRRGGRRRAARAPSSTCVRSVASSARVVPRLLRRSRARRGASPRPRRRSLPHAVITTTGSVGSSSRSRAEEIEPLAARGRVARVVEIDQHDVELLGLGEREHRGRRGRGPNLEAVATREHARRLRARPAGRRRRVGGEPLPRRTLRSRGGPRPPVRRTGGPTRVAFFA